MHRVVVLCFVAVFLATAAAFPADDDDHDDIPDVLLFGERECV